MGKLQLKSSLTWLTELEFSNFFSKSLSAISVILIYGLSLVWILMVLNVSLDYNTEFNMKSVLIYKKLLLNFSTCVRWSKHRCQNFGYTNVQTYVF